MFLVDKSVNCCSKGIIYMTSTEIQFVAVRDRFPASKSDLHDNQGSDFTGCYKEKRVYTHIFYAIQAPSESVPHMLLIQLSLA